MGTIKVWDGSAWQTSSQGPAQNASQTAFTPTGTIAATDVQSAIAEAALEGPGQSLVYNEFTSAVTITATSSASANTIVTGSSFTFDGNPVWIEFFAPTINTPVANVLRALLFEDGAFIGFIGVAGATVLTSAANLTFSGKRRMTPSAGSHTYSIRGTVSGGSGDFTAGAGGSGNFMPGYISITRA